MSKSAHFVAWDARCRDRGSYGMTAGDSLHLGLRDYNEPYPCPNGLPLDLRQPGDCEHWRRRVAKARRFIGEWNSEQRVLSLAESLSIDDVKKGIEVLRQWANSLRQI
jgi:hypothetical protein